MKKVRVTNEDGQVIGWDEITTKCVRFDGFVQKKFQKVKSWNDYVKKYKVSKPKGRGHCEFCGVKWPTKPDDEWTAIVQTTKGNKIICKECFEDFNLKSDSKTIKYADDGEL